MVKMSKVFKIIAILIISTKIYSCQYYNVPGFDLNNFKNTPLESLSKAVKNQDEEKIKELVKQGNLDLEYYDPEYGNTILMNAVANNLPRSVETLLKLGANPNQLSNLEKGSPTTPLLVACRGSYKKDKCNTKVLELLIKYGGDVNFEIKGSESNANGFTDKFFYKETPLSLASRGGCLSVVKVLVESGADVNKDIQYPGYRAITEAIIQQNMEVAYYLIVDKKAEIPKYCLLLINGKKKTVTDLINKKEGLPNFEKGTKNYKLGQKIKKYLKSIGKE